MSKELAITEELFRVRKEMFLGAARKMAEATIPNDLDRFKFMVFAEQWVNTGDQDSLERGELTFDPDYIEMVILFGLDTTVDVSRQVMDLLDLSTVYFPL